MSKHRTRSWAIVTIFGLAATLGCSSDPAAPLTVENLLGELAMFFTSSTANEPSASSSSFAPEPGSNAESPYGLAKNTKPSEIHIFITSVQTELAGGTQVEFSEEVGDVELLSLFGRQLQVVEGELPTGTYSYVVFRIDRARSFVLINDEQQLLDIPGDQVRVEGPFVVGPGGPTTVVFDLDPVSELTENADGSWTLLLVIIVTTGTG